MPDFIQTLVFAGAPIACAILAYQTFALRQERKRLHRAVTYYEDTAETYKSVINSYRHAFNAKREAKALAEDLNMCGGCGLSATSETIAACVTLGKECPNFKKTIAPL